MKKFIYTGMMCMMIFVTSCKKDAYLTRDNPVATTEDKWWKTQGQLDNVLGTLYNSLPQGGYAGNPNVRIFFSTLTDDAIWNGNFYGSLNTVAIGDATPTTGAPFDGVWQRDYSAIRLASRFINNAGAAYMDEALRTRYIAEARAIRAWSHLELMLYYGDVPIVSQPVTTEESSTLTNSTRADLINFISDELDLAANDLPSSYITDQAYRVSKGACLAMKAILFLNNKMYPETLAAIQQLKALNQYSLYVAGEDPYRDLFSYTGKVNQERIFFKQGALNDIFFRNGPQGISRNTTQAAMNPTASIVDAFETKQGKTIQELGSDSIAAYHLNPNYNNNRDPRLNANVFYRGVILPLTTTPLDPFDDASTNLNRLNASFSSVTGYWCAKYIDPIDAGNIEGSTLDLMLIRYADVLLMEVEALVESNDWQNPLVIQNLNLIRNRAGMPNVDVSVYNSQENLRELYRRERRVELAFEGSRFFDIRRWNIGNEVMNGRVLGATNPNTNQAIVVQERRYNSQRDILWPIPQNDINTTEIQQNPGW